MSKNFFDELSKLTGGMLEMTMNFKQEAESFFKNQFDNCADNMKLVRKEELDRIYQMLKTLEERNDILEKKITELQNRNSDLVEEDNDRK